MLGPVVEDLLRGDRPHPGELVELLGRRRRETRLGPDPRRRWTHGGTGHGITLRRLDACGRSGSARNEDLDTVDEGCSEIQRGELGGARCPSGASNGIGDSCSLTKAIEARPPHRTDDVDDECWPSRRLGDRLERCDDLG
jgi:hypothetical protein